jgi:hypothetical protein
MQNKRMFVSGVVVAAMLSVSSWIPAQAAMIGTEQAVTVQSRDAQIAQVQDFLGRADVQKQLESWGVAPEQAQQRVASLSDAELQQLALTIDQQPAGGDGLLVVLGVVFVVLLVLELVGVTNIFSRI